jgi:hypothetical protein
MPHLEFSKENTALLVIDPYNEFISAGPPEVIKSLKSKVLVQNRYKIFQEPSATLPRENGENGIEPGSCRRRSVISM